MQNCVTQEAIIEL